MFLMDMPYSNIIMWIFSTPVVLWFGKDFFINAWKQAKHRSVNMDTLVAISTGIAYLFSVFNVVFPNYWHKIGLHSHVYFEASAVIISFILLGKFLEEKAKDSTSNAIKNLIGLQSKTVTIISKNLKELIINIEDLRVGDIVLVKPGEKIAVDGVVVSGSSNVNESMLSGEPIPVNKVENDKVFAGTINIKGSFKFKALKIGKDTVLSQIIKAVQDAQGSKAKVQKTVDKIARIFVPTVISISIITFLSWLYFGGDKGLSYGLLSFITVLIIACPCALGLATPTAIMVGIGKGATNGILIKDAQSLELANKIDVVILDKTGTITEGKPVVNNIMWYKNEDVSKNILFSIEKLSEHPLADAITSFFSDTETIEVQDFVSVTGKGATAKYKNESYYVGNKNFLFENNINIDIDFINLSNKWENEAKTVILFSDSKKALAILSISDTIKSTSALAIKKICEMGIDIYMLTGDNEKTAKSIAEQVNIKKYKAELLPNEKADFIKKLQNDGKIVAMVGDGINDSTALATADVSIAMGNGSDIAIDVAKITILKADLNKIPQAIKLSKQTVMTIRQNLFWAFIYNIIGIPIAAGVLYPFYRFQMNPMFAGAAMAFSSVSVVSNSILLKWKK